MGPDTQVTEVKFLALRELIEINFRHVRERLEELQDALGKLASAMVTETDFQHQVQSVQRAHKRLNAHDEKLRNHQFAYRLLEVTGAIFGAVVLALLVAFATGKATIVWQ